MKEEKKIKRKASKFKKLPSHHGMILQGPNQKLQQSMTTVQDEEEEEVDEEEQENIRKMKEKVIAWNKLPLTVLVDIVILIN